MANRVTAESDLSAGSYAYTSHGYNVEDASDEFDEYTDQPPAAAREASPAGGTREGTEEAVGRDLVWLGRLLLS